MEIFFYFFIAARIMIAIGSLVTLMMWPRISGRAWLIAGFASLLASELLNVGIPLMSLFIYRNSFDHGSAFQSWYFSLSQIFYFVSATISLAAPAFFLVAVIVLADTIRGLFAGQATNPQANPGHFGDFPIVRLTSDGKLPHRGSQLITLAIMSVFFWPMGIVVRIMAGSDLKKIRAEQMDPEGKHHTEIAYSVGVVTSLILVGASVALVICLVAMIAGPR